MNVYCDFFLCANNTDGECDSYSITINSLGQCNSSFF